MTYDPVAIAVIVAFVTGLVAGVIAGIRNLVLEARSPASTEDR